MKLRENQSGHLTLVCFLLTVRFSETLRANVYIICALPLSGGMLRLAFVQTVKSSKLLWKTATRFGC